MYKIRNLQYKEKAPEIQKSIENFHINPEKSRENSTDACMFSKITNG